MRYKGVFVKTFKKLKTKHKFSVISYGKSFAVDKKGFVRYAKKNWDILNGDYVRAIIASAELLIERPDDCEPLQIAKELYLLQKYIPENTGKAVSQVLERYFDNGQSIVTKDGIISEIADAYDFKIKTYLLAKSLEAKLCKMAPAVKPLLSNDVVATLKSKSQNVVILSLYKHDKKRSDRVYQIDIDNNSDTLKFNDNDITYDDKDESVVWVRDAYTGKMIKQNFLQDLKFNSTTDRQIALYNYNEVAELYEEKMKILKENDELYRCNNQVSQKVWKNIEKLKKKYRHFYEDIEIEDINME